MVTAITGLNNSGKSTIRSILTKWGYVPVIEYTTRPSRKGEKNHVEYHFIDDAEFDRMNEAGDFAEILCVSTMHGVWKYGAKKEDMKDGSLLICGPHQMKQLLDSEFPMLSVLLDIDRDTALDRAAKRGSQGDDLAEFDRRFTADEGVVNEIRNRMTLVVDATNSPNVIARMIDSRCTLERSMGIHRANKPKQNTYRIGIEEVTTAQSMDEGELHLYLEGDQGLKPYLRMKDRGMPKDPVNQIAWLLLQGAGCGFCKVCRDKSCGIKDGEKCTTNIANYIRECVHAEDQKKKG